MVGIPELWLPIAAASVIVFLASSILHMLLPFHRADYRQLPDEDGIADAIRRANVAPGQYMFPWCADAKTASSPEMKAKFQRGPVGVLVRMPDGGHNMGKYLGLWLLYCVLVSVFAAYLAGRTLAAGADYLAVFRISGTVAFGAYGLAHFADSIWKGQPWSNTARAMIDGVIYAGLTGGAFGWLWPA